MWWQPTGCFLSGRIPGTLADPNGNLLGFHVATGVAGGDTPAERKVGSLGKPLPWDAATQSLATSRVIDAGDNGYRNAYPHEGGMVQAQRRSSWSSICFLCRPKRPIRCPWVVLDRTRESRKTEVLHTCQQQTVDNYDIIRTSSISKRATLIQPLAATRLRWLRHHLRDFDSAPWRHSKPESDF